jgi:nitrogen fixation protein FixH
MNRTEPRPLTGGMVLAMMLGFFAVIIGVNAFMAHEALSTFRGVDADSAYRAGQQFAHEVAAAEAQDAEHLRVDVKVTPVTDGVALLDVVARDASGAPLAGLSATAIFARPTDRHFDLTVTMSEQAPGRYHGTAAIAPGQWDLILELSHEGERRFRSKNRVVIK